MTETQKTQTDTAPVILNEGAVAAAAVPKSDWRFRNWSFTINNYTDEDLDTINTLMNCKMRVGKEVGDSGTPHLQGYIEFTNPVKFDTLKKKLPRAHLEPSQKGRHANIKYCAKEGNLIRDDFPEQYVYKGEDLPTELYPWEKTILDIISVPKPNNRELIWIIDEIGNNGKSIFGKYLEFHYKNVCYCDVSKSNDIITMAEAHYTTYYFDFPRCLGPDFQPFTALEKIMNGCINDCKLKKTPRKIRTRPPWVIVVSNHEPDRSKLSADRWRVYHIDNNTLYPV